jgi:branched-chain amino acid transport system substrate-binding protein
MTILHVLMDANLVVTSFDEIQQINLKDLYPNVKITIIYECLKEYCALPETKFSSIQESLRELNIEVVHLKKITEPPSQIDEITNFLRDEASAFEVDYVLQTQLTKIVSNEDHFNNLQDSPWKHIIAVWTLERFKKELELTGLNGESPELPPPPPPPQDNPPIPQDNLWTLTLPLIPLVILVGISLINTTISFAVYRAISISPAKPQFFVGDDMSRGEEFLSPPKISEEKCKFQRQLNTEMKKATKDFQAQNYGKAAQEFEDAMEKAKDIKKNNPKLTMYDDPELRIYKENAKARNNTDILSIAVVVPLSKQESDGSINYTSTYCNRGRPILFGVAMAQEEINKQGIKINGKNYYLEVVIANDRNDKDYKSKEIARKIVQDKSILGVIGHNSSAATQAALEEYNGNIVVVTSTSTASDLGKDMKGMFYRTVTSNQMLLERLVNYLKSKNINKVAVVYEYDDTSSKDYSQSFKDYSAKEGININREIEIKKSENILPTDITGIIKANIDSGVGAILHFTQTEEAQKFSLKLIQENTKQPKSKQLLMLGGDSLYQCDNLGPYSSGLILSVPWFKGANEASKSFNEKARDSLTITRGDVHWRTATSYDATIAFADAFAKYTNDDITRGDLDSKIQQVDLPPKKTSGEPLKLAKGKMPYPKLVKVVQNKNNKTSCNGYDFEKVDDPTVSNSP